MMKPKYTIDDIKKIDLTTDNLFVKMGIFSIPFSLTSLITILNSTLTLIIVKFLGGGPTSSGAVSSSSTLILLVTVMFTYIGSGMSILISNNIGSNNETFAKKIMHTSLLLGTIFGIFVLIFGYFMTPYLLKWISTDSAYLEDASLYMRIYFLCFPLTIIYTYINRVFQSIGNARTPFFVLLGSLFTNVLFSFIFVHFAKLNVLGLSLAYVISNIIACVTMVFLLVKNKKYNLNLSFRELKFDKEALKSVLKIGLPVGIQRFVFAIPGFFVQSALYQIANGDVNVLNGAIAAGNISNYLFCLVEGITESVLIMTALNYGAKNTDNIKKIVKYGLYWSLIINAFCSLIALFAYAPLLMLFVNDSASIEAGKQRLWIMTFTYILCSFADVFANTLKGLKHTISVLVTSVISSCIVRIIYIQFFVKPFTFFQTIYALYLAYGISWLLCLILNLICYIVIAKRDYKKIDEAKAEEITTA